MLGRPRNEFRTPVDLVAEVREGGLRVPAFQRGFKWGAADVLDLFDSVLQGFPIGNLLFWRRPAPAQHIAVGPLTIDAPALDAANFVVDGQQRITSLVGALAAAESATDPRFRIYLDLEEVKFHSLGLRQTPPQHWLPVSRLVDTMTLNAWTRANQEWLTEAHLAVADSAAKAVREYQIPTYVVIADDEAALRQIFDRLNSTGKPLTKAEVFNALHSGFTTDVVDSLPAIGLVTAKLGFGALADELALRCVLAYRGGDVFRTDFQTEFLSPEDRDETFRSVAGALHDVVDFLRGEAGISHVRLLPYTHVVPVLTRFVRLHGTPAARVARLLRRWVWRDAVTGVSERATSAATLRQAMTAVAADTPLRSANNLLALLPATTEYRPDLTRMHLNHAAAKINLLGLLAAGPRDLLTGAELDIAALFDTGNPVHEIVPQTADPRSRTFANRIVTGHRAGRSTKALLVEAPREVAETHLVDVAAQDALRRGDVADFLRHRQPRVQAAVERHLDTMAEWGARDGISIADMIRSAA
jgi:hypothetical protein